MMYKIACAVRDLCVCVCVSHQLTLLRHGIGLRCTAPIRVIIRHHATLRHGTSRWIVPRRVKFGSVICLCVRVQSPWCSKFSGWHCIAQGLRPAAGKCWKLERAQAYANTYIILLRLLLLLIIILLLMIVMIIIISLLILVCLLLIFTTRSYDIQELDVLLKLTPPGGTSKHVTAQHRSSTPNQDL